MQRHSTAILFAAALLGLSATACTQAEAGSAKPSAAATELEADGLPAGPYGDRDPALAKQLVEGGALVLDVRTPEEFAAGHVDGAVNISHTDIGAQLEQIKQLQGGDTHKPIVLYCRSGHRAGIAKKELAAAGFDRVTNLGGMKDWPK